MIENTRKKTEKNMEGEKFFLGWEKSSALFDIYTVRNTLLKKRKTQEYTFEKEKNTEIHF